MVTPKSKSEDRINYSFMFGCLAAVGAATIVVAGVFAIYPLIILALAITLLAALALSWSCNSGGAVSRPYAVVNRGPVLISDPCSVYASHNHGRCSDSWGSLFSTHAHSHGNGYIHGHGPAHGQGHSHGHGSVDTISDHGGHFHSHH